MQTYQNNIISNQYQNPSGMSPFADNIICNTPDTSCSNSISSSTSSLNKIPFKQDPYRLNDNQNVFFNQTQYTQQEAKDLIFQVISKKQELFRKLEELNKQVRSLFSLKFKIKKLTSLTKND